MPRSPRVRGDDVHYHVILRLNNKERLLQREDDFRDFLSLLAVAKKEFFFRLYNYDLLNSHIHLMLSTHKGNFVDKIMHLICFKYAKGFNKKYGRIGHLWAHRYRSRLILSNNHAIACLRYQHRNAMSAGLVEQPRDWPWSGYRFYAFGEENEYLELHPSYVSFFGSSKEGQKAYRHLVETWIPADKIPGIFDGRSQKVSRRFSRAVGQVERLMKR